MKNICFLIMAILMITSISVQAQKQTSNRNVTDLTDITNNYRDIFADTWVATDGLGRTMPTGIDIRLSKKDHGRVVGIFYITWHTMDKAKLKSPYSADVSKILAADTNARFDAKNSLWTEDFFHWGEPETGYFLSRDEYVIRHDMSMLADAGVDVIILDVTNAEYYWDEWRTLFAVMEKMKDEGNEVPQFCFWTFSQPVITVVQNLYDSFYKLNKYKDLWFFWDGKPLLLCNMNPQPIDAEGKTPLNPNPHYDSTALTDKSNIHFNYIDYTAKFYKHYTQEVKKTFTMRTMWWGYYEWEGKRFVGTEDNWSFGYQLNDKNVRDISPDSLVSLHNGKPEEMAVTPAQHACFFVGKSWSLRNGEPAINQYDLPDSAYVPWLNKKVAHPEGYGIYFQERWNDALKKDPPFIYLNDWNEWGAGKFQPGNGEYGFMNRKSPYYFVDQYNAEFNRAIQPMKGGYKDNYYMQMAENIRLYKGARPIPIIKGNSNIKIDGSFNDWNTVKVEYRDTKGDIFHRDFDGYGGEHYINTSGRNDIVTCKTSVDENKIFFYAETHKPLTPSSGKNWMLLLIDADQNAATGWNGYDFIINKNVINDKLTTLMKYDSTASGDHWVKVAKVEYRYNNNKTEVSIPTNLLKLSTNKSFSFDFHWCDNPDNLDYEASLWTSGDSAPNRRFNYRCIWQR